MTEAPKLPEPFVETDAKVRNEWGHYALFTADQLREYGAACAREERERCAAAVRAVAFDGCHEWTRETVEKCIAAILAGAPA